jgi:hypothetical protein
MGSLFMDKKTESTKKSQNWSINKKIAILKTMEILK